MKAIRVHEFGGPEVLQVEEIPDPIPAVGQVLVRVHAVGVNPVDTYVRAGTYALNPPLPYTPGSDAAGVVEAVGEEVAGVQRGARVYIYGNLTGAYAEKVLCRETQVYPLPEGVSFEQGAALGVPYGTAYYGLMLRARPRPGEVVLVHGASGGVGIAAVQIARAFGLTVIGTGGSERGRELVKAEGAQHVLDHGAPDYLDEVKALTGGRGVDIVLEMLANVNLDRDLSVLAPQGRVIVIGSRGRIEIDPRQTMTRNADIRGMSLVNASPAELKSIHAAVRAGLENGTLRPVISENIPLSDAPRAHEAVVIQGGSYGKIVLTP